MDGFDTDKTLKRLQRQVERQRLDCEGWRDMVGLAALATFICVVAAACLDRGLAIRVAALGGAACVSLTIPAILKYRRWRLMRRGLRRASRAQATRTRDRAA